MRLRHLTLLAALTACGDKDDSGTEGDSGAVTLPDYETDCEDGIDNDGDGYTDYDDEDCDTVCTISSSFTSLLATWQVAIKDGQINPDVDTAYGNTFNVMLVTDYWDGTNADTEACMAHVEVSSVSVDSGFVDAGGWSGWSVPAGSDHTTSVGCKYTDPSGPFGPDPAGYFIQNYSWGFGIAPDSGEFTDFLSSDYDAWLDGLLYHEVTGDISYDLFNYVIAYEMDDEGGVDASTPIDLSGLTLKAPLPDGYYVGNAAYGFNFR